MHITAIRPALTLLCVLGMGLAAGGQTLAALPTAPTPIAPGPGAGVTVPFPISWSAVTDPSGVVAYNWQVDITAGFTSIKLQNSTNGQTQDIVSGLPNGSYFWRVQAVNGAFVQGTWSQPQSFTITGAGPTEPGTPTLAPTKAYSTFHPYEVMTFNWTAVPGAATYVLQFATDPSFPIITRGQFDNIPNTTMSFAIGNPEGAYSARVYAVSASGIAGVPSNVIPFSVFFNNPIGPPPALLSPATGTSLTLPVTLTWADVPNPQPSGYELEIARDSGFSSIEEDDPQITDPTSTLLSLTSGTKFWRVRSIQGDKSPLLPALTAWSAARSFTIPATPPKPVSVTLVSNPVYSGDTTFVAIQLTSAAPASGATVNFSSSNPAALPVPSTLPVQGNIAWGQFQITAGQVTVPTVVTLTATLNSGSASVQVNLLPPSLKSLTLAPSVISGGAMPQLIVMLNGQAPAGGAAVSLTSNSGAVQPPAIVNIPPGIPSASISIPTSTVATNTTATLTANWNGVSKQSQVTLTAQQPPTSVTLSPTSTVGQSGSSFATVSTASPVLTDNILQVTVDNPIVATMVPSSVMIPAGSTRGGFNIFTTAVTTQTLVTIFVSGGGVTKSATLTVTPSAPPPATLSSIALSPSTVIGGNTSQCTVTLTSAAPSSGAAVILSSSNTARATVPGSVTVPAGATSATFPVSTATVTAATSATIGGAFGGTSKSAVLTISKPSATASLSSVAVSPASVVGGAASQGTVTLTSAAPFGGFTSTLSSGNPAATVPSSVTVTEGATTATFAIATSSVTTSTPVTVSAIAAGVTRTATLTLTPPAQSGTLTVTATGRSGEHVTSSPAGINVAVGNSMQAPFAAGTAITLTVSNGRNAVWSGACANSGSKTCTFTFNGTSTVTAKVQ